MTAGSRVWIRFPIGVLHLLHHRFFGVEWADSNLTPSDPSNLVSLCLNGAKQKGSVDALLIPPIFHLDILLVFALHFLHWRLKGQVLFFPSNLFESRQNHSIHTSTNVLFGFARWLTA